MFFGMVIISAVNRHFIAKFFFPDMPRFLRISVPFHLLYFWTKPYIEKWIGVRREIAEDLH